ncbi:Response regulator receiver domain-containing protein [Algoriphagus locisalis]|uniref:Response regulator receiver domain-containing protein n=1 Tax=Algoriphagus locisalis TaxID=305507 RepID=A0A1I7DRE3_9BACT|nr:response regulator [Algoriphagus locisalis]SFU14243.1 Response regulator receiver domain-containing protein [Algoriphagus locisalis]
MKKIKLLIIDDDALCLMIANKSLRKFLPSKLPYQVEVISNPVEGLNIIQKHIESNITSEVIVILLDINMPILDGWAVLEELDILDPEQNIQVYMHSSSISELDIKRSKTYARVRDFIHKPLNEMRVNSLNADLMEFL